MMNNLKTYKYFFVVFLIVPWLFWQCRLQDTSDYQIDLSRGTEHLNIIIGRMNKPFGVWPMSMRSKHDTTFQENTNILYKDSSSWNEFFLFDKKRVVVLLSPSTTTYLSFYEERFYTRLLREYNQIKAGKQGQQKKISSTTYFKSIGTDHRIEVYFTPKEFRFNTSFKMSQISQHRPRADLWRLIESAKRVSMYMPHFEDQQLFDDMRQDINEGKSRLLLAKTHDSSLSNLQTTQVDLGFSFILGEKLQITSNLLDKQDINFQNQHELKQDFLALFSLPIGNSHKKEENKNLLNTQDGIVVVIRGNINKFKNFILQQQIDLSSNTDSLFEAFNVQYAYPNSETQITVSLTHPVLADSDLMSPNNYCLVEISTPNDAPTDCTNSTVNITNIVVDANNTNQIVLTTEIQTKSMRYVLFLKNIKRASDSKNLDVSSLQLATRLKFTEIFNKASEDAIEIMVERPGLIRDFTIYQKGSLLYKFLNIDDIFESTNILVFHSQETGRNDTRMNNNITPPFTEGYDFFISNDPNEDGTSLSSTTSEIEIRDSRGFTQDFLAWSNEEPSVSELKRLESHVTNQNWVNIDDMNVLNWHDYVNSSSLSSTTCFQRVFKNSHLLDRNSAQDWFIQSSCSLGVLSSTEEPDIFAITNSTFSRTNEITLDFNLIPTIFSTSNVANFTLNLSGTSIPISTIQQNLGSKQVKINLSNEVTDTGMYTLSFQNLTSIENNQLLAIEQTQTINFTNTSNADISYLVISEIGINVNEQSSCDYVEIFNPTSDAISLLAYSIQRASNPSAESLGTITRINLPNFSLPSNEYFLIADNDWNTSGCNSVVEADVMQNLVINNDDSILLVRSTSNATSCDDDEIIDKIGFGDSACFEEMAISNLSRGDSIERKHNFNSTSSTMQNADKNRGHSFDTNNNHVDFVQHDNYQDPQKNANYMAVVSPPPPVTPPPVTPPPVTPPPVTPPPVTPPPVTPPTSSILVIAEVGNKLLNKTPNDYILLYNNSGATIDLSTYYIGRDSSCRISTGDWTEYRSLPDVMLDARHYYLISRTGNTIDADFTWSGALGTNYCVVLANSSTRPTSATDANVIDFVAFGSTTGEGGTAVSSLSDRKAYKRKGTCREQDTNNNNDDFEEIVPPPTTLSNSNTAACVP